MSTDIVVDKNSGNQTTRTGFGSHEIEKRAETAATAAAEQQRAAIQARYIVAMQRPRDLDTVRQKLLKECERPSFARVARYHKPVGQGVEGPSIRFAEAAIRCMGNITPNTTSIYDDAEKRILRVSVTDLEANVTYEHDVTIEKTVERNSLKEGDVPISQRLNSRGKKVYILPATEDDMLNKENARVSKALRTLSLRLVPGDLVDEAMDVILHTLATADAKDPDAERKRLFDAFAGIGVMPADIKSYLQHDVATASPRELAELRAVYQAVKDGESSWAEVMAMKASAGEGKAEEKPTGDRAANLAAKLKGQAGTKKQEGGKTKEVVDADGVVTQVPVEEQK